VNYGNYSYNVVLCVKLSALGGTGLSGGKKLLGEKDSRLRLDDQLG